MTTPEAFVSPPDHPYPSDRGELQLVTSAITLLEVLVIPYAVGDAALASRYEALLTRGRGLALVDLERSLLRAAPHLRAAHRLRAPDAIQMAAALAERCACLVRLPSREE